MHRIAAFHKVSFAQFQRDVERCALSFSSDTPEALYHAILLPSRATSGSAGYDFFAPFSFSLHSGKSITVPTGIRAEIDPGWFLGLLPRSGHGFRYRVQLDNTMGVIDSDYFHAESEGHILIKLSNNSHSDTCLQLDKGTKFTQGIFLPHGIVIDDKADTKRVGGFGSTD